MERTWVRVAVGLVTSAVVVAFAAADWALTRLRASRAGGRAPHAPP